MRIISILYKIFAVVIIININYSCTADIEDNYRTFKGEMIYTFLKNRPEQYSEFVKIIDRAGLKGTLSAYGDYTCLAPTNEAFAKYYADLGQGFNIDKLSQEQIDYLAKTHIVDNKYVFNELGIGVLPNPNMNRRYITFNYSNDQVTNKSIMVLNDSSQVISIDNEVFNGIIQGINRVLRPSNAQLPELIKTNDQLSIFTEALKLTGMFDSLLLIKDDSYKPTKIFKDEYDTYEIVTPPERKYGYTALVESNSVLSNYGINNINDLILKCQELYPNSLNNNDYTNREHSLNKFVSYHLVNKAIYLNKFFFTSDAIKGYTPDEFIETMYPNRIIKASMIGSKITLNPASNHETAIIANTTKTTINGVYHLIDKLLVYDESVDNMLQNTRIRFDIVSLFPEFANNNLRGSRGYMKINNGSGDRFGFEEGYIQYLKMSKDTRLIYLAGKEGQWANFQSDELMGLGSYDLTMRLLPVPPGTYELRFAYSANSNRSVTQIYIDNKPIGIPLDLRILSDNPKIGWLLDNTTEDNGVENDKMMRNRGYMKGPNTYYFGQTLSRNYKGCLRRIIGTFTFTEYSAHTLRFRSVIEAPRSQCMMDYFEFVPKNIFSPPSGQPESRD